MPINAYTGLMGSGKSFECVVSVILPALAAGRRVVTNVDGIDNDACRAYCVEKFGIELAQLGQVIHCKNEDLNSPNFLPHGTDAQTLSQPGDMVCIDEAWRFWGTDCKILKEHAIFFREHRHYVDPMTKVSCDLVLMVQDISDLHRQLRVVVELTFRTTKIKSLGLNKIYRVEMWEGYKLTAKARSSVENKKYDKQIFPLYSSYVGGKGKELQVDKRQNILNSKKLRVLVLASVPFVGVCWYGVHYFFDPTRFGEKGAASAQTKAGSTAQVAGASLNAPQPGKAAAENVSEVWRITGTYQFGNQAYVVLANTLGRVRLEHPSAFQNKGLAMVGEVDGERVMAWSGPTASAGVLPGDKK